MHPLSLIRLGRSTWRSLQIGADRIALWHYLERMRPKVLCIEDDLTIQALVAASLPDYDVITARTLKDATAAMGQNQFSALLVDIQLPDGDGLRFIGELAHSKATKDVPALVLSNHDVISNKVMAFSLGAEDFIGKPFDPIELRARVSAKIRRRESEREVLNVRRLADIVIDLDRQKCVQIKGSQENDLGLTGLELKILLLLTRRMEQVFSRDQIIDDVWGQTHITDRTVDSHVAHLRQKLKSTQVHLETVKNIGYRVTVIGK